MERSSAKSPQIIPQNLMNLVAIQIISRIKIGSQLSLLASLLLLLLLTACYEDVEGCLDPAATNYALSADLPCPNNGCCTYPSLRFSLSSRWEGEVLRDSFYPDAFGNRFRLEQLRFYWSDIRIDTPDGQSITPTDSIAMGLRSNGDTLFRNLNNNLALFSSRSTASRSVGTIGAVTSSTGFSARLGLADDYQQVLPSTLPTNHPLYFQEGRLYYGADTGFVQLKLQYELLSGPDTLARSIEVFGSQPFALPFNTTLAFPRGFNVLARVTADLPLLLNSVNLAAPEAEIANQLANNAPFIFTVTELLGER